MTESTLLLRQVNPAWIQAGRITSQVFKPTPKDEKRLSVYDGDSISAEKSWQHFTAKLGHKSAGVIAVTVAECAERGLEAAPDPTPFPEHVVILFDGLSNSQIERSAKHLRNTAVKRGWQFEAAAAE